MSSLDDAASPPGGERARGLVVGVEGGRPSRPAQAIRHGMMSVWCQRGEPGQKTQRLACSNLQCSEGRVAGFMAKFMAKV